MTPTTKRKWLQEGLALLAEAGATALTIEVLTSRLGVTKGSLHHPSQLEVSLRAWALQDPFVQSYQQRIDQRRLAYLEEQAFLICHDRERAHRISQLFYSIFVGSQHIFPPVQGHELEALYREVGSISDFLPSSSSVKQTRKES